MFRTAPEWAIWCRGAPNTAKDGISPLDGLIETDWLPYTFTMNWRFTRPGTASFSKGEAFCFLCPIPHLAIEAIQPRIMPIDVDPALRAAYDAWKLSRAAFNARSARREPVATDEKMQRFYLKGAPPVGDPAPATRRVKRRMAQPLTDSEGE